MHCCATASRLAEVKLALQESNANATGGYLDEQGPYELLVRSLGRVRTTEDIGNIVVKMRDERPVLVSQLAQVREGPQVKRGDSSAFVREQDGEFTGGPAVVLTINKQPNADTRAVSDEITAALADIQDQLPPDIRLTAELYQQRGFIDLAIANVAEALRDGSVLVVIILFLFLLNFRTTFITLTAIPLSIVITGLIFAVFGLSINTMTLGGLAVAIGELVDDAIVDVENIFRRLKLNRHAAAPQHPLRVVFEASAEIRNSIVFGTAIVVLVFVPVFALSGMEGRLFTPLGVAYIVSILSSLVVSLTVTPVLSYWLLAQRRSWSWLAAVLSPVFAFLISYGVVPGLLKLLHQDAARHWWTTQSWPLHAVVAAVLALPLWALVMWSDRYSQQESDGLLLWALKWLAGKSIAWSLRVPYLVMLVALLAVLVSGVALWRLENDFLPPFDEGAVQINVVLPAGTSLATSQGVARKIEQRLMAIPEITAFVRKTGRAELDEHAVPVNMSEFIATLDPHSQRNREEILEDIRDTLADVPGIVSSVEQPLAHLISHMLSGVQAQVAIKLYGDDLEVLRRQAKRIESAIVDVPGVTDLFVEKQVNIPQLKIQVDGHKLQQYGLRREDVNRFVETAMHGEVVSEVLIDQRTFDLMIRLDEASREDIDAVKRLTIDLPGGGTTSLESVARIQPDQGPNTINREQVRRRIVIQCNTSGRGLVDVVDDIRERVEPVRRELPTGYFVEYGGQFESQKSAARRMIIFFSGAVLGVFLVLYTMLRSANLALQVMVALPLAFIGSVAALYVSGQTLTVAAMVGFISLCGIASRNGILLINHYLHLVQHEGESWTAAMVIRAGQERVAPVLMTAFTSGVGLVPLALAAGQPGKEILYPVATVIIGGLVTSTLLEFLVRPAMFWTLGLRAARAVVAQADDPLQAAHKLD